MYGEDKKTSLEQTGSLRSAISQSSGILEGMGLTFSHLTRPKVTRLHPYVKPKLPPRSHCLSKESCGKCVPCRVGVKRIAGILEGMVSDLGVNADLGLLDEFASYIPDGSLCGFGVQTPNPLKTARRYWPEHFRMHIEQQQCPTGTCVPLRAHRFATKHVLP